MILIQAPIKTTTIFTSWIRFRTLKSLALALLQIAQRGGVGAHGSIQPWTKDLRAKKHTMQK